MGAINTMRAVEKAKGIMRDGYAMNAQSIVDIRNSSDDLYIMIYNGFLFGYMQGIKAAKAEQKARAEA